MNGTTNDQPLATPHGFGDDARSAWLRRRPPRRALLWLEETLGGRVRRVQPLKGGSSSAIHAVTLEDSQRRRVVILRRYVIDSLNAEEPDIADREARVLRLLRRAEVPTPELLAADPTGEHAGSPTVVMSRIAGRLDWSPIHMEPWLRQLAETLPRIHAAAITLDDGVQAFAPYEPESWDPPEWLTDKRLWWRALEVFHGPCLDPERMFVHRDFHPGNVLWRRGRVSGVVDWQAASVGPRSVDVWHCRGNLLSRFGVEAADRFLALWQDITGEVYNPWAEAVMLVDAIGWMHPRARRERIALEALLARRLSELGR